MSRILFTGFFPLWSVHFVTELDLIEKHLADGDEVHMLACNAELHSCECNKQHILAECARCIGSRQHGISLLSQKIKIIPIIKSCRIPKALKKQVSSIDELKRLCVDGYDIGESVYSSLVDRTSNTHPDVIQEAKNISSMLGDSYKVWMQALSVLSKKEYDRVYVFNGRFNTTRPWIRACQKTSTPFYTHERMMKLGRVSLTDGTLPHDPLIYSDLIESHHKRSNDNVENYKEGVEFFEERPKGIDSGWHSFITKQKRLKMPRGWDPQKRNIVFFGSTESELVGLRSITPEGMYKNQSDALIDLIPKLIKKDENFRFYLKVHPNSEAEKNKWWEDDKITGIEHLTVIRPDSDVSTYDLLSACEKSLCWNSTIGVEATFWEKPSIVLELGMYSGIDAVYEPRCKDEAIEMLVSHLMPKPKCNAIKYGSYMRCGGLSLRHAEVVGVSELKFKGVTLAAKKDISNWSWHSFKRSEVYGGDLLIRLLADKFKWVMFKIKYKGVFASNID